MKAIVLSLCVLLISGIVSASPYMCGTVIEDPATGKRYQFDLTPLYHDNEHSDTLLRENTFGIFYFNICGETTAKCSPASPVCGHSGQSSKEGFGSLHSQTIGPVEQGVAFGKGVTVRYTDGEECPNSINGTTSSKINIICGDDENVTTLDLGTNGCYLSATIVSKAGCGVEIPPSSSSESSSSISEGFCLSLTLIQVFIIALSAFIFY